MKPSTVIFGFIALVALFYSCGNSSRNNNYANSYGADNSDTTAVVDGYNYQQSQELSPEDEQYVDNSLSTGASPYSSVGSASDESQIKVSTSADYDDDVVVIIKSGGRIFADAYIVGGESYSFDVPNGEYQVFFYSGKGWNPNKQMTNGRKGGFVKDESFSKDSPVSLDYQGLEYSLIPQPDGNFDTQPSNIREAL